MNVPIGVVLGGDDPHRIISPPHRPHWAAEFEEWRFLTRDELLTIMLRRARTSRRLLDYQDNKAEAIEARLHRERVAAQQQVAT